MSLDREQLKSAGHLAKMPRRYRPRLASRSLSKLKLSSVPPIPKSDVSMFQDVSILKPPSVLPPMELIAGGHSPLKAPMLGNCCESSLWKNSLADLLEKPPLRIGHTVTGRKRQLHFLAKNSCNNWLTASRLPFGTGMIIAQTFP